MPSRNAHHKRKPGLLIQSQACGFPAQRLVLVKHAQQLTVAVEISCHIYALPEPFLRRFLTKWQGFPSSLVLYFSGFISDVTKCKIGVKMCIFTKNIYLMPPKCLFLHKKVVVHCTVLLFRSIIISTHTDWSKWIVLKHKLLSQVMRYSHSIQVGTCITNIYVFYVIIVGLHRDAVYLFCVYLQIYTEENKLSAFIVPSIFLATSAVE